jgi:hypothetical protein
LINVTCFRVIPKISSLILGDEYLRFKTIVLDNQLTSGGEVFNHTRRSLLTTLPVMFGLFISVIGLVEPRAILRLEGLGKLKQSPVTSTGFYPAAYRPAA